MKATQKSLELQLSLLQSLNAKVAKLNIAVNRVRTLRRQLSELEKRLSSESVALLAQTKILASSLLAVEGVLVDVKRESSRDVLRHPAGLNDTLSDMIGVVAIADEAPTSQARQVSEEIMAKVDIELAKLDKLFTDEVAALNLKLRGAGIEVLGGTQAA